VIWLLAVFVALDVVLALAVTRFAVLLERHSDELDDAFERIRDLEDKETRRLGL